MWGGRVAAGGNNKLGNVMAGDEKKTKTTAKEKAPPKEKTSVEPQDKTSTEVPAADTKVDAPKNYNRGEGQKAVTQAYKDNWNAIYGKKKKR